MGIGYIMVESLKSLTYNEILICKKNKIHPYIYAGLSKIKNQKILIDQNIIINIILDFFDIKSDKLFGASRKAEYVRARCICFYVLRKHTTMSLKGIGRLFNKDHSTIIYAIRRVEDDLKFNKKFTVVFNNCYKIVLEINEASKE